jgi:hypothetical protein
MRRRVLLVAAAIGVGAALALAGTIRAQVPTEDSVIGSGSVSAAQVGLLSFEIDARSGPSGENPSGTLSLSGPFSFSGPVTCLAASGNVALLDVAFPEPLAPALRLRATDNSGLGTPDVLEFFSPVGPACSPPTASGSGGPLLSGDLVVVDAQPFPTSKDQCKNGGWQSYGIFKNQGDCVSFVGTGGKNPPAGH